MKLPASTALQRFFFARLSPQGEFGLHLTVGLLLLALSAWIFSAIAAEVMAAARITVFDLHVAHWFHVRASPGLTRLVLLFTHLHSGVGIVVLALLLGGYFYRRKAIYWLLALAVAVPGGMLLNVLLKYIFTRARPSFENPILTLATYSFPSGHTASSTLLYGMLAAYLWCILPHWRHRCLAVCLAVGMVLLVGLSRIYLGVHYLSDVLAAVAESGGWLAVCITSVSTLRRRRLGRSLSPANDVFEPVKQGETS